MGGPGFFTSSEQHLINVGGEQFRALAVALMDSLKHPRRSHETSVQILLEALFSYYPTLKLSSSSVTPVEQISMLLNRTRKTEMVERIAFVLRQLTIDEIYRHPLTYREVFEGLSAETAKDFLRQTNTALPYSALNALAHSLKITILLSFVEPGKELRKCVAYACNGDMSKLGLDIQVQKNLYFPKVKAPEEYSYVGKLAISPLALEVEINGEGEATIAQLVDLIAVDNKRILHSYNQLRRNLQAIVDEKKLTLADLTRLYIKFLPEKDSTMKPLLGQEKDPIKMTSLNESSKAMKELLVNALAQWVSMDAVAADLLFDTIENQLDKKLGYNR